MKDRILKDLDEVCREMVRCITSTRDLIAERGIGRPEVAKQISGMVVDMGSLLQELQQGRGALTGDAARMEAIARLASSCKDLEGMIKEVRNDLEAGADVRKQHRE